MSEKKAEKHWHTRRFQSFREVAEFLNDARLTAQNVMVQIEQRAADYERSAVHILYFGYDIPSKAGLSGKLREATQVQIDAFFAKVDEQAQASNQTQT